MYVWMVEPVVSSTRIFGNSVSVVTARGTFSTYLEVIGPIFLTTRKIVPLGIRSEGGRLGSWSARSSR